MTYGLIKGLQCKLIISFSLIDDLTRWNQNTSDNSDDVLIMNLRDSKNKIGRDREFSRLEILRDMETETLQDQDQFMSHVLSDAISDVM